MPDIRVVPLGAGQDVGRSCILVTLGGKNIMLDCGMHMGFNDERRFPYFNYITGGNGRLTEHIDCVIISHFHLDHCGALPYMSEMVGFDGPIYMTHPTKAICPILLEDYRKITVEKKGETDFFTSQMIKDCMKKVVPVNLHQTVHVDDELQIKAYYAGHVLGAAMFYMKVGTESVLYTGDYNMTPDRHLGAAWVDKCRPSLLITESTYATTIRDSKRCRERDFLKKVHETIEKGGKVLIPVFALGRAQELCILLESYWERMNLKVPIYFSTGLTNKATEYYKLFITWTNQKIKNTFVERNMFDFKHIKSFNRSYIENPGPMIVFATPGMLHGGLSLELFKKWCTNEKNMIIMPGYCVAGTVGNKILSGMRKIELKPGQVVEIKMQVQYMSFSAHADAKGIMQLIRMCEPGNVMLVHGEAVKMEFLKSKINKELHLPCFKPANGETVVITTKPPITVDASMKLLHKHREIQGLTPNPKRIKTLHGVMLIKGNRVLNHEIYFLGVNFIQQEDKFTKAVKINCINDITGRSKFEHKISLHKIGKKLNESMKLVDPDEAVEELQLTKHELRFTSTVHIANVNRPTSDAMQHLHQHLKKALRSHHVSINADENILIDTVLLKAQSTEDDDTDQSNLNVLVSWSLQDEELGTYIMDTMKAGLPARVT